MPIDQKAAEKRNYITVQDVNEELSNVVEKAKPHFDYIWTLSSPHERLLLAILTEILRKRQVATVTVIVAALGASAFIVFAMPKNITAQPRNVIGGHIVGVISGGLCALVLIIFNLDSGFTLVTAASISVGLAIFIMVVTDTEHPPGCSTALGLVVHASTLSTVAYYSGFVLISALILSGVKHVLDPRLKDLV